MHISNFCIYLPFQKLLIPPCIYHACSLFFFFPLFCYVGIEDLKSGKIVTPLPAKATFMDDPLRVLRAIRFGTYFYYVSLHQRSTSCILCSPDLLRVL